MKVIDRHQYPFPGIFSVSEKGFSVALASSISVIIYMKDSGMDLNNMYLNIQFKSPCKPH